MAENQNNVNLDEEVPGCEDNYYRCIIKLLRISRGWIDLFSTFTLMTVTILGAVAAGIYSNSEIIQKLNIAISVISGAATSLRILKEFTVNDEAQRKELLREVIRNNNIRQ